MKYFYNVQCDKNSNHQELEINVDTVYKRTNIRETENGYTYDEIQMTIPEYLRESFPENEKAIGELGILLATYQNQMDKAIAELTMLIGGTGNV